MTRSNLPFCDWFSQFGVGSCSYQLFWQTGVTSRSQRIIIQRSPINPKSVITVCYMCNEGVISMNQMWIHLWRPRGFPFVFIPSLCFSLSLTMGKGWGKGWKTYERQATSCRAEANPGCTQTPLPFSRVSLSSGSSLIGSLTRRGSVTRQPSVCPRSRPISDVHMNWNCLAFRYLKIRHRVGHTH